MCSVCVRRGLRQQVSYTHAPGLELRTGFFYIRAVFLVWGGKNGKGWKGRKGKPPGGGVG